MKPKDATVNPSSRHSAASKPTQVSKGVIWRNGRAKLGEWECLAWFSVLGDCWRWEIRRKAKFGVSDAGGDDDSEQSARAEAVRVARLLGGKS